MGRRFKLTPPLSIYRHFMSSSYDIKKRKKEHVQPLPTPSLPPPLRTRIGLHKFQVEVSNSLQTPSRGFQNSSNCKPRFPNNSSNSKPQFTKFFRLQAVVYKSLQTASRSLQKFPNSKPQFKKVFKL